MQVHEADILRFDEVATQPAELIVCMGDTITHLPAMPDVEALLAKAFSRLATDGKLVLSFRDMSVALEGDARFIPVKADASRILTCFLEYLDGYVRVTDLLHERVEGAWVQKVSSYCKLRISCDAMTRMLQAAGFSITSSSTKNRLLYLVASKGAA